MIRKSLKAAHMDTLLVADFRPWSKREATTLSQTRPNSPINDFFFLHDS